MQTLLNKRQRKPKGQYKTENTEKLATQGTKKAATTKNNKRNEKTKKNKSKTQHNMCWTPLYTNKHK